jgi:SagB-type dehydrogenase family enzyme
MSLWQALERRRSQREFATAALSLEEVALLLWAAQGISGEPAGRTAPSPAGVYPLELYVLTSAGLWRYRPASQSVEVVGAADRRVELAGAAHGQAAIGSAAAVFAVSGIYRRSDQKYGERAERFVQLEAGHVAQNLLLAATALGLASFPAGAFDDERVAETLGLADGEVALYLVAVGRQRA